MNALQTPCPQGIRTDQVSAFYDSELGATATAALREHLATCDVCQRRLSDYARISATLREQAVPQPDARLRQNVMAARARTTPSLSRFGWTQDTWRATSVAAAVILIVGSIASLLLNHAALTRIGASTATPTLADSAPTITPAPSATAIPATPPGWRAILPTRRFGAHGFAVSAAAPGRLIGCGVSSAGTDAWPYPALAISDDGGHTWHESDIQAIGSVTECDVVVDQIHPDTIIVGDVQPSQFAVTTDAGRTWRALTLPAGMRMNFSGGAGYQAATLVNGHLIGIFIPASATDRWMLGDLSLNGSFKVLDARLPYPNSAERTPTAFAVNPANPAQLFVIAYGRVVPANPQRESILFGTLDAGATWRQLHIFDLAERISLWAPRSDALYAWVEYPELSANGNPLQESIDGGATWRSITSTSAPLDAAWFGPGGQIVLLRATGNGAAPMLDELNPST
ncbi:MAG TPA: zf-HC2 domain-containing protein, partial [Ktedonobacterales bacterium]|nr:zf-HC2 domain-containing protein [Ktedonobacterales bacterium]